MRYYLTMAEREILVVVPRGTKVLYMEADVEEVYLTDTALFKPAPEPPLGSIGSLDWSTGVPVYEAEPIRPGASEPDDVWESGPDRERWVASSSPGDDWESEEMRQAGDWRTVEPRWQTDQERDSA